MWVKQFIIIDIVWSPGSAIGLIYTEKWKLLQKSENEVQKTGSSGGIFWNGRYTVIQLIEMSVDFTYRVFTTYLTRKGSQ